ncbi:MAG: hypothetical protein DCF21_21870 [Leptolyngbya sp.]|nr:MAG: hypothetical protein DCF21_21870 [Leptolyngbya sp.]
MASAPVTAQGIVGDRQKTLKYHGGPDRALGLWSLGRYRRHSAGQSSLCDDLLYNYQRGSMILGRRGAELPLFALGQLLQLG